ncbi:MAG: type I 3-dehydroquinate dehydratase [Bacteroidales bacterium]|nr:type I 3-dehydroquinate dehydratase [Bacteroidales bacterium]MDD4673688.1 type I 3-dehydroquinate dehydratase [Bacteroidales bacterium]MDY0349264.1 type I 3-dehydroquinate dehydratase [Tenuifilaceae bacterium]
MRNDICLSIGHADYETILELLKQVALAEIRIDLLYLNEEQLKSIFTKHNNLIAAYRSDSSDNKEIEMGLNLAIENGCKFIDIDIEMPELPRKKLITKAHTKGCKVIISYHNFTETPSLKELNAIIDKLFESGADLAKLACMANSPNDCARVMGLYENHSNLVAFCMGDLGKLTRLAAPILGAPFTYASAQGKATAPGQMAINEVELFLNSYKFD